jgi:hypothetical protein
VVRLLIGLVIGLAVGGIAASAAVLALVDDQAERTGLLQREQLQKAVSDSLNGQEVGCAETEKAERVFVCTILERHFAFEVTVSEDGRSWSISREIGSA